MRVQRFVVFNGYGFPVPSADLVAVPTPSPFAGFGGEWEDWCDKNYYTEQWNTACKNCNKVKIPLLGERCTWPDPKTMAGRAARGLPSQTDLERLGPPGTVPGGGDVVTVPEAGDQPSGSWFDQNKTLVIAGGAAVLGLALAFGRRGRRMNGLAGFFGFGKRRTRRKA